MKGAFFQKPFEWQIELSGESWEQGSELKGTLSIKNCSSETLALSGKVIFGEAEIKKIQTRDPKAFKSEDSFDLPSSIELKSQEVRAFPLNFKVPENGGVTDKKSSYYVGYGPSGKDSHLQINIVPKKIFGEIIKIFETFMRFKLKEIKASKGAVEYKLLAPTSREFAHVEGLHLFQSMHEANLHLEYQFKVKKLDTASVTTKVAKDEKKITKVLGPREYSMGRDMINQEGILKSIQAALDEVKMKNL